MICLDISINGSHFCRAGIEQATVLVPILSIFVGSEDCATLSVTGMCELPKNRDAHVYWPEKTSLSPGDFVRFTMIDADDPTKPSEIEPTDSPKYIEEQRQFEELDKAYVPRTTAAERLWPTVGFRCTINGEERTLAVMTPHEEHIMCSIAWNRYQPSRSRIFVRSFGRAVQSGVTEWLRADLLLNDTIEFEIHA